MKRIFFIALLLLSFGIYAQQPGSLDKNFGRNGVVTDSVHDAFPVHIALQSDGKSVAAGSLNTLTDETNSYDFLLTRRKENGSPDSSFGDEGSVTTSFGLSTTNRCYAVSIQPDGNIVAAGTEYTSANKYHHVAVARYLKDGSLDKNFGKEGLVAFSIADQTDALVTSMAIQSDGKIVIAGNSSTTSNQPVIPFLVRFTVDRKSDASFGDMGVEFMLYSASTEVSSVTIQPDGNLLVGGTYSYLFNPEYLLSRYLPDGTPDKGFGKNGVALFSFGRNTASEAYTMALQEDGSVVCGGYEQALFKNLNLTLVHFTSSGNIDSSFGTNGAVITQWDGYSEANKLLIQSDGKIITAGTLNPGEDNQSVVIIRYFPDGTIDSSFGKDGLTSTTLENGVSCSDALQQRDGKILVASDGFIKTSGKNVFVFARYNNDLSQRQRIVTKIKRYLQHHGITWQTDNNVRYYTVQRSLDGGVTYQPVAKLYNNHQSVLMYEDAWATGDNAVYRVAVVAKDGGRSFSNSITLSNESNIRLFPNPVHNSMQLQGLPAGKAVITIADFSGNIRISAVANSPNFSVTTSALPPGNYLLKVQSGGEITTKTFVKE